MKANKLHFNFSHKTPACRALDLLSWLNWKKFYVGPVAAKYYKLLQHGQLTNGFFSRRL